MQCPRLAPLAAATLATLCANAFAQVGGAITPQTLPAITVRGEAEPAYAAPDVAAAGKSDALLLESPMSVQVIPRAMIDDQKASTIKEAIRHVSGVVPAEYDYYTTVQIRGFANDDTYRNSLPMANVSGLDTALVEQIEVVKGPASMLYGRIEPGGLVNMVMKRPLAAAAYGVEGQVGSFGLRRATGDATGPLTQDGTLLYRVTGAYTTADSFMDFVERTNKVGAAGLTWKPNARFQFNLALEAQNYRFVDTEDIGIPVIGNRMAPVPRERFLGDPVSREIPNEHERTLVGFDWTYAINDQWKLSQRFHRDARKEQQSTIWFNGFDGVSVLSRGLWYVHNTRDAYATNLDLTGAVDLAGMKHRILVGADYYRHDEEWHGYSDVLPERPDIDIFSPVYGISAATLRALPENFFFDSRNRWVGVYAQDQINVTERLQVLAGGRYDRAKTGGASSATSLADASATLQMEQDKQFSPRLGVLYRLSAAESLYASYSKSFGSNNGRSASNKAFDPEVGRQVELGAKHQSADGSLNATVSVFQLEKTNILTEDLANPGFQIAIGEIRNRGLELDLAGRPGRHLDLIGSYTFIDSRITRDNSGNEGRRVRNVPRHAGSLWAKFSPLPGEKRGWDIGAGIVAQGQRQGDDANTWQLPGYARVDAMLRYRLPLAGSRISAQLNVENLFDRTYVDRGGFGGTVGKYGSPRAATASLAASF